MILLKQHLYVVTFFDNCCKLNIIKKEIRRERYTINNEVQPYFLYRYISISL